MLKNEKRKLDMSSSCCCRLTFIVQVQTGLVTKTKMTLPILRTTYARVTVLEKRARERKMAILSSSENAWEHERKKAGGKDR